MDEDVKNEEVTETPAVETPVEEAAETTEVAPEAEAPAEEVTETEAAA